MVTATYGNESQHCHRHNLRAAGPFTSDVWFFDFGGRPLASLEKLVNNGSPQTLLRFYTTDHLNTPLLATDATGNVTWSGGFDPFGGDSFSNAQKLRSYQRFPGQWQDNQWYGFSKFADFSYNVHRWYDSATGRYTAPDPQPPPSVGHVHTVIERGEIWVIVGSADDRAGRGQPDGPFAEDHGRFRATVAIVGSPDERRRNPIGSRRSSVGRRRRPFGGD